VIVVNVELSYFAKVKGISDTTAKIESNKANCRKLSYIFSVVDFGRGYEVRCKGKSQADLTKMMNEQLLANENINSDIIYTVVFDQWFYQ